MEPRLSIHLINPLWNAFGGSELRTMALQKILSPLADVTVWGSKQAHPTLALQPNVRTITPWSLTFPRDGCFVFMGAYFKPGRWTYLAQPGRIIIVYNTDDPDRLEKRLREMRTVFRLEPEIVFCSESLKQTVGLEGVVEVSPIELAEFSRVESARSGEFVIGRLSRAEPYKHHHGDLRVYAAVAAEGMRVRVMGATDAMQAQGLNLQGVELLAAGHEPAADFLRSLDCFFYRTDPSWTEPWGRVILEAMASGVPVVAENRGGYAAVVKHGVNGFLFESEEEAFAYMRALREDVHLRQSIADQGYVTARELLGETARQAIVSYYLSHPKRRPPIGARTQH